MSNKKVPNAFQSLLKWHRECVLLFGRAPRIFSHSLRSIWSWYYCRSPVRGTQHLLSCLFNPIYARAWLRWKGGKWWKLSCLFTSNFFHSSGKRVQAPYDINSEMKAANLTVSGTELWCLPAHCLLGFHTHGGGHKSAQLSEGVEEDKSSDLWHINTYQRNQFVISVNGSHCALTSSPHSCL